MPTSYQPLHESVRATLDPEYVALHDEHLQFARPINEQPWHPSLRDVSHSFQTPIAQDVKTTDLDVSHCRVRVYTPEASKPPASGWPVLVWYHGGGWVTGGIASDGSFCSQIAKSASTYLRRTDRTDTAEQLVNASSSLQITVLHPNTSFRQL